MARSMASISVCSSTNLLRARSDLSRSGGPARTFANGSRSSSIRARAAVRVARRSFIGPLSLEEFLRLRQLRAATFVAAQFARSEHLGTEGVAIQHIPCCGCRRYTWRYQVLW